jgi:flagellar assembly factor FliW
VTDAPEVWFRSGLPGFPGERRFGLVRWGASEGPYSVLVDLDDPTVRFLVAPPEVFFPSYEVELTDDDVERLGLQAPDEALILVIVRLGDTPAAATANLLGPVVINTRTCEGVQVVQSDAQFSTQTPLFVAA